jgi:hypothetical protein
MQLTSAAWYGEEIAGTEPKGLRGGWLPEETVMPNGIHVNYMRNRCQVLGHR